MSGSLGAAAENTVLDLILGSGHAAGFPATVYVALFTVAPTSAGGGTEVSGGSYARAAVTNNTTNWPAAASGIKSNGTAIVFPAATASWGTIVAFALFDAATVGVLIAWGTLTTNIVVPAGDTAQFLAGQLIVTAF